MTAFPFFHHFLRNSGSSRTNPMALFKVVRVRLRVGPDRGSTLDIEIAQSSIPDSLLTPTFRWVTRALRSARNRFNGLIEADPKLLKQLKTRPVHPNTSMNRGVNESRFVDTLIESQF